MTAPDLYPAVNLLRSYAAMFRKAAPNGMAIGVNERLLGKADCFERAAWALVVAVVSEAAQAAKGRRS